MYKSTPDPRRATRAPALSLFLAACLLAVFSQTSWTQDCTPDFRPRSTKEIIPLTSDPIEPGGTVQMILHICNDGDDPFGPGCGGGEIVVQDWLFTNFYFENASFVYWDPDHWKTNNPGAPCRVIPSGNALCATNVQGVFDPNNPATGGCTDVILEADVRREIPDKKLCNQAFVQRGTGPLLDWCTERGGSLGCTSPPNNTNSWEYTCVPINIVKDLRGTKKIINITGGSDPDILETGETITYEICLENYGNSMLKLVRIFDYLPIDGLGENLFVSQGPECVTNFTQDPDVGARQRGFCFTDPPFIEIHGWTEQDFWLYPLGDPNGPSSVCFTYDLLTRDDLAHKTVLCNHAVATWQNNDQDFPVPMDGSSVCEQIVDGPHFAGSTKSVNNTSPAQGSSVTFTLHIENVGNQAANGIIIEDQLNTGCFNLAGFDPATALSFSPAPPNTWTASMTGAGNDTLHIEIDDQFTQKTSLDITFTLPLLAGALGKCCNTAIITSPVLPDPEILPTPTVDPVPTETDATLTCFDIGGAAVVEASKSVTPTGNVMQGNTLNYTITLDNLGSQTATELSVIDDLDECLDCSTFQDDPAPPTLVADCVARNIFIDNLTIPASGQLSLAYSIDLDTSARLWPPCCNEAFVSYRRTPSDPTSVKNLTSNRVCTNVEPIPIPDFSLLKDVPDLSYPRIAPAGGGIEYQFTVENTGTMDAMITIVDTFEPCLDISNFNPATSVQMQPGTPVAVRLNARTLEIDVNLPWGGSAETITLLDITIDANAPAGICSNQASIDFGGQTWLSDDPADPTGIEPTDVNVIRMGFDKDVANMSKPRLATRGTPVEYVFTIDNVDGVDGAATIRDRLANCLDIQTFDPAIHVTAVPGPITNARVGGFPPPGRTLIIDFPMSAAVAQQVITVTGISIAAAAPLDQLCENQATLSVSGASWTSNDPEDDPPLDDATDILVVDVIPELLRRQATTVPCPLTAKPADMGTIFGPRPASVAGGPLPWEFTDDLLEPPGSESCLIFYESDNDVRIALIRGQTNPNSDVRLESY